MTRAQDRSVPLWAFRLMAERPPQDSLGVVQSFYFESLVKRLEAQAKRAREFETGSLPAGLNDEERHVEQSIRRARTSALEHAARQARQVYEQALKSLRLPPEDNDE